MRPTQYARCLGGIIRREALRFLNQRGRFVSALVRPLVWLLIFATGFHVVLGVSNIPPYETYIPLRGVHRAGIDRHDPAVQRDAKLALHGL